MSMNITAVVTVHNKEKEIARALQSVCNQTLYPHEIIVVDDGSTDYSVKVIEKMHIPRLHLVRQCNTGVYGSRNRGIIESKTELVAFLDGDDTWEPEFLETIAKLCQKFPSCGIYGTAFQTKMLSGNIITPRYCNVPERGKDGIIENYFTAASKGAVFSSSSVAIPKKVFSDVGMFTIDAGVGGDKEMWVRIAVDYPVAFCNKILATWHKDASNRVSKNFHSRTEPPCVTAGQNILARKDLPLHIRRGLSKYLKTQLVFDATGFILSGESKKGRKLLLYHGIPSSCPVKWFVYLCMSYLPNKIIIKLYKYTHKIRFYLSKLFKRNFRKANPPAVFDKEPKLIHS